MTGVTCKERDLDAEAQGDVQKKTETEIWSNVLSLTKNMKDCFSIHGKSETKPNLCVLTQRLPEEPNSADSMILDPLVSCERMDFSCLSLFSL